jgi:hypothetical protein
MLLFLWLVVGSICSFSDAAAYPFFSTLSVGIGGQQKDVVWLMNFPLFCLILQA